MINVTLINFIIVLFHFREAMTFRDEVQKSPEVQFAMAVFHALNSNNSVRFFRLVRYNVVTIPLFKVQSKQCNIFCRWLYLDFKEINLLITFCFNPTFFPRNAKYLNACVLHRYFTQVLPSFIRCLFTHI